MIVALIVLGGAAMAAGSMMPWMTIQMSLTNIGTVPLHLNGTDTGAGKAGVLLALGIIALAFPAYRADGGPWPRLAAFTGAGIAVMAAVVTLRRAGIIGGAPRIEVTLGVGLWVLGGGLAALLLASYVEHRRV